MGNSNSNSRALHQQVDLSVAPSKRRTVKQRKIKSKILEQKVSTARKTGVLNLSSCGLKQIPATVLEIENLRVLDVSFNQIEQIPAGLSSLRRLKTFNVSCNPLSSMCDFSTWSALQNLECEECNLTRMPSLPPTLTSLKASYNINMHVSNIASDTLTHLELRACSLKGIPALKTPALVHIDISFNEISSLSTEEFSWSSLPNLQVMLATHNKISATTSCIPKELLEHEHLLRIQLTCNPGVTQKLLLELPGIDSYLKARKGRIDKNISSLQDRGICGVDDTTTVN